MAEPVVITDDLTRDSIFNGRITIIQPRRGYRFSLDAILLADFTQVAPGRTVVDLGAGSGVVGLALARKLGPGRIVAVEIQDRLAQLARRNFEAFSGEAEARVLCLDWRDLTPELIRQSTGGLSPDLVVSNPPYRKLGSGRINPGDESAAARHEIHGSLVSAAQIAARLLNRGGRLSMVYPALRLVHLLTELKNAGFEPKRLRLAHSRPGEPARLVLVEASLTGGEELMVEPPLFIYKNKTDYTDEVSAVLAGE